MDSLLTQIQDEAKKMQTEREKISEDLNNKVNEFKGQITLVVTIFSAVCCALIVGLVAPYVRSKIKI
ncbi:MAG: hypothetical protein F4Z10_06575 [Synechococcus sp. SB0666_bin_14]|nr:hypothetical protein [Synechococcus sp. SB0666_bin_14]MYG46469.1 hypothetical protein [Synechococcus sp. SB0675_bin_6]